MWVGWLSTRILSYLCTHISAINLVVKSPSKIRILLWGISQTCISLLFLKFSFLKMRNFAHFQSSRNLLHHYQRLF